MSNSLRGSDTYRIYDLVKTVEKWQQGPTLKNTSSPHTWAPSPGGIDGIMLARAGAIHCGTIPLAGRSVAAYGDQSAEGKCGVIYVIGVLS